MLARLAGPDAAAARWPVPAFEEVAAGARAQAEALRAARAAQEAGDAGAAEAAAREVDALRGRRRELLEANLVAALARAAEGPDPFRERLAAFWADHFALRARDGRLAAGVAAYVDEAIRPHLAGRFADMLRAAVLHPMMLLYLDQTVSVGPGSPHGLRTGAGLNENLAREVLELHTLGVAGGYSQTDVRELAKLFTGLGFAMDRGFVFRPERAEPGAETVLGLSYGGGEPRLEDIVAALDDLAARPETARHLAWKLAVHFTADRPEEGLVAHLEAAWRSSGGALPEVYAALVEHPATWAAPGAKVRRPFEFVAAGMRALGAGGEALAALRPRERRRITRDALRDMGQPHEEPPGPDGWPEEAERWITPQGLAARIGWAMRAPRLLLGEEELPDPRAFVDQALGPFARAATREAAAAAETRAEGVGIVLAAPEFNRR